MKPPGDTSVRRSLSQTQIVQPTQFLRQIQVGPRAEIVGRTPWSAAGPLARQWFCLTLDPRGQGAPRRPGGLPHKP
jgi:hypothetical protein